MPAHPSSPDTRGKSTANKKRGVKKALTKPNAKASGKLATRKKVLMGLLS